jgi:predicted lipoprotein with Yx(FWY)xxD motif
LPRSAPITFLATLVALPVAALVVAGCGGGGSATPTPPKTADGRPATLGVGSVGLGKILVNSRARTLYLFKKDSGTTSSCFGACAANWPPLRARGAPTVGSGAKASLVATTMRSDAKAQVTYNGHPLYTFVQDTSPGDTNGQGSTAFGAGWFALNSAGNQVTAQPSSSSSSSSSSGGGGGYGY